MKATASALVGRGAELARLSDVLQRAAQGEGGVALVSGEPGIGKTALLEALADEALQRGFVVAWGRAWELGGAPTYWLWIEALRTLLGRAAGDNPHTAEALEALLPELGGTAGERGERDELQLYDSIVSYLEELSRRQPLALLFDDLHAADATSVQLAAMVARRLRQMPVALLAGYREVEARRRPAIEAALSRLGRCGETSPLGRLDEPAVGTLVCRHTGAQDAETARMIHQASEGNPLFVRELLRLIAARGDRSVPAGVRSVIRERLALLSPATVALLQTAAVVGREFSTVVAAEVAGVTPGAIELALDEACEAELLSDCAAGRMRFSHALVAETLAGELTARVRARLHRTAAEVLERRHAGDPAAPVDEIAHHLLSGGDEAAARAVDAALTAAQRAIKRMAFSDGAELYQRALGALDVAAPADATRRAELLCGQAEALVRAGDRPAAEAACERATALARELDDGALFARAALALGAEGAVGGQDPKMIRLLDEALQRLPAGSDALRAEVTARWASARQPASDPLEPIAAARKAVALAERVGDEALLLRVLDSAMGAMVDYAPADERARFNERQIALADRAHDRPRALRARIRLLFDRIEQADMAAFERELTAYEQLADELRQPRYRWVPPMFRSMCAMWQGRFDEGWDLHEQALAIRERAPGAQTPYTLVRRWMAAALREDREALLRVKPAISELWARQGATPAMIEGAFDAVLERPPPSDTPLATPPEMLQSHHLTATLSQVAWWRRDAEAAQRVYAALAPRAGQPYMVTGIGYMVGDVFDRMLLRMAAVAGDAEAVDRHARAALALCGQLAARPIEASTRCDWAIALAERGEPTARERARALAEQARATADELGMPGLQLRCAELLARLDGAGPDVPQTAGAPAGGSPAAGAHAGDAQAATEAVTLSCEGDYWVVSGFGERAMIKDSRGMRMLARLVAHPHEELHALDLSGAPGPVDGGDSGEAIDEQALAAYRARLRELRAEIDEAEQHNDPARRRKLEAEQQALTAEIAGAVGLGGRSRRVGAAAERARSNVRRRLVDALTRIEDGCPELGAHFAAAVRTGTYCAYEPPAPGASGARGS